MEASLKQIHEILQRMIGFHRNLLDLVRQQREAIAQAELSRIQEITGSQEFLIENIRLAEAERVRELTGLALVIRRPLKDLTIGELVLLAQSDHPKLSASLQTDRNTLQILVQRIEEQNRYNAALIQDSLGHVQRMKLNVLGEGVPKSDLYTAKAQRSAPIQGARLISTEL